MIKKINGVKLDFHQLVEYSLNAILIIDYEKIIYANKASLELLELTNHNQLIGMKFMEYLHPEFHSISKERLRKVREEQKVAELMEQKLIKLNGEVIDVEVISAPYFSHDKVLVQVTIRDITDRKLAQKNAIQSEKMKLTGELAAGIVHDIRNPLTAIKGFLQLMLSGTIKIDDYIKIIRAEIENIEDIANELLLFSKPSHAQLKAEDVIELTKETIFLLTNQVSQKKLSIDLCSDEETLLVRGNKTQLKQVMINLIKNAIEATPPNGEINIKLEHDNESIGIIIRDTGCGIPQEKMEKLGQSFYTTKETGTGLGLMITKHIIKTHNGTLSVESEEGKGTIFHIKLPFFTKVKN